MEQKQFAVLQNEALTKDVFQMVLSGDTGAIAGPGQFVMVALPEKFLRRPISVCDWDSETLTLIYKTVGAGTEQMSDFPVGTGLSLLTGLGNGYDLRPAGERPLLVGGGVGVPPLYGLAKRLLSQGKRPQVVLGFNTKDEIFYEREFRALGCETHVATADGSCGTKGFVTDVIQNLSYTYFYACGPMPMFRAMEKVVATPGEYSFEERMGCGFGACMSCSCRTKNGYKRVCKDGPVLKREEVLW